MALALHPARTWIPHGSGSAVLRQALPPAHSPSSSGSGRRSLQRSGPTGTVHDHPPSSIGVHLPDRDVVERVGDHLTISRWNLQGDGTHHIPEVARTVHVLQVDGSFHAHPLGRLGRSPPELLNGVASL